MLAQSQTGDLFRKLFLAELLRSRVEVVNLEDDATVSQHNTILRFKPTLRSSMSTKCNISVSAS